MKEPLRLLASILIAAPCVAEAYIGPGVGISAIGSFLAVVGAILLAIVGFVWFPLKRMLSRKNAAREEVADKVATGPDESLQKGDSEGGGGQMAPED